LDSRRERSAGRRATKTFVASAAPKLARLEMTSALTVTNATVPRSCGASARARMSTDTK
jgi:hypothetical protein